MSVCSYYPLRTDATWSPISSKTASDYLQESRQLRQSLAALEWRNFSLCQARRQITYQRRLHLGDERFSLGWFRLYVEPQQRPHHLDGNSRIAMRLDRGYHRGLGPASTQAIDDLLAALPRSLCFFPDGNSNDARISGRRMPTRMLIITIPHRLTVTNLASSGDESTMGACPEGLRDEGAEMGLRVPRAAVVLRRT